MTPVQFAEILTLVALAVAGGALVLIFVLRSRVKKLLRQQRMILGSRGDVDLVSHIADLDEKLDHLRMAMEDFALAAKDHEVRIDGCLSRVGLVRFDAYEDLGGRQSTSIALLTGKEDGMVVTTMVTRDHARIYVKTMNGGKWDIALAPEESEAVDQALSGGGMPFTVRPRLEELRGERAVPAAETVKSSDGEDLSVEQLQAAVRALERENRRRARRGLAPLDELPPAASSLGWSEVSLPKLEEQPEEQPVPEEEPDPDWESEEVVTVERRHALRLDSGEETEG